MFSLDLGNLLVHLRMDDVAVVKSLHGIQAKLNDSLTLMENHFENFSRKMTSIGIRMSAAVTLPLVAGGKKSVETFAEYEKGLSRISTVLQGQEMNLMPKYDKQIKQLALTYGESTKDIANSLDMIVQAAFKPSEALKLLEIGIRFAKAGFTDTETAVNALIGTLNAYGLTVDDAKRVTDMMFATITRGTASAEQFSKSIGRVTGIAAVAGIQLGELFAAFAGITRGGLSAEEAATALRGVLIQFMKPADRAKRITQELTNIEKELGFELTTTTLRTEGLISVLEKLSRLSEDSLGKLVGGIVGDARALTGFSNALKGLKKVKQDYDIIMNSSGYAQTALAKAMDNLAFRMKQAGVRLELLKISIGEGLEPVVNSLMDVLRKATNLWLSFDKATQQTILRVGLIGAALGPIAMGIAGLSWMFSVLTKTLYGLMKPIIAIMTAFNGWIAVSLLLAAVAYAARAAWNQNLNGIKERLDWFVDVVTHIPKFLLNMFYDLGKYMYTNFTGNLKNILSVVSVFVKILYSSFITVFKKLKEQSSEFISDLVGTISGAYQWIGRMKDAVWSAWTAPNWATFMYEFKTGWKEAGETWAEGFVGAKETTDDGMAALEKSISDGMNSVLSVIGEKAEAVASTIKDTTNEWIWMAKALPEAYTESAGGLLDAVKKQWATDLQSLSTMMKSLTPGMFDFFDDLGNRMEDVKENPFIKGMLDMIDKMLEIPAKLKAAWDKFTEAPKIDVPDMGKLMTDESIESAIDKMYSGLNQRSEKYFDLQAKRIEKDTALWEKNAKKIASIMHGKDINAVTAAEVKYVEELIAAYKDEQEVLMEIEKLKFSDRIVDGFKAAGIQIKREIKTWGERAHEFTTGMVGTLENGFMNMAQDMQNWAAQFKATLKELYFEALRLAFFQPAAQGIANVFNAVGSAVVGGIGGMMSGGGGGSNLKQMAKPLGRAAGGLIWQPEIARLAENEPELVTPLSKLKGLMGGGNVEFHLHNDGSPMEITSQTQYMMSDKRIIDVTINALGRSQKLRHAVSQAKG